MYFAVVLKLYAIWYSSSNSLSVLKTGYLREPKKLLELESLNRGFLKVTSSSHDHHVWKCYSELRRNLRKDFGVGANVVIESDKQGPMSPQTPEFSQIFFYTHLSRSHTFCTPCEEMTASLDVWVASRVCPCPSRWGPDGVKRNYVSKQDKVKCAELWSWILDLFFLSILLQLQSTKRAFFNPSHWRASQVREKVRTENQSAPFQKVPDLSCGFSTSQALETPLLITRATENNWTFCGTTIAFCRFRSCLWYVWHEIGFRKFSSTLKMWAQIMWNWMKMQALRSIGSPLSQTTRKFTNEKFSGRGQILLVIQTYVRGSCHLKAFAQGVGNFEIDSSVGLQQLHLLLDSQLNVK